MPKFDPKYPQYIFSVYVLQNEDTCGMYIGCTSNMNKRYYQHLNGESKLSFSLGNPKKLKVLQVWFCGTCRDVAYRYERYLQRLQKKDLLTYSMILNSFLFDSYCKRNRLDPFGPSTTKDFILPIKLK